MKALLLHVRSMKTRACLGISSRYETTALPLGYDLILGWAARRIIAARTTAGCEVTEAALCVYSSSVEPRAARSSWRGVPSDPRGAGPRAYTSTVKASCESS